MQSRLQWGPALRRPLAAAAVVGAAAVLCAVTLGGTRPASAAAMPACVHPHAHVALPSSLERFPLPRGTVIDAARVRYGYTIVSGYVPGAINPVRDFFVGRLPSAGFRLGAGDAEPAEAESGYRGHGVHGRWKVRALPGCPGALALQIAVR